MGSVSQSPVFSNIVNGECRSGTQVDRGVDPRTEKPLWDVPVASPADLNEAVAAARNAFPGWANTPVAERKKIIAKMADVVNENAPELIEIVARETGKSQLMASIEIKNTVDQCLFFSQNALEDELQYEDETVKIMATFPPLGVVGAICPWNFPLILSSIKVVASLVMGNCIIIKASPFTPYSALKFAELVQPLLPPGVVQALSGDGELGRLMTEHAGVDKISFTGSSPTGKLVAAACARTLKKVTLELGGNDAAIVCPDVADVAATASLVAAGSYFNAGQVCVATKRVYVHEDVYAPFLEAFVAETTRAYAPALAANGADAPPTVFGPLSNKMQFDKVKGLLQDVKTAGGEVLTGGAPHDGTGFWIQPTVVAQPPEDSRLVQEEQFGPVVPIMKWSNEDDVIKRANLTNSGLGATVYSKDLGRAESIAKRLEVGSVWINVSRVPRSPHFAFTYFADAIGSISDARATQCGSLDGWVEGQRFWRGDGQAGTLCVLPCQEHPLRQVVVVA
ncbi:hypothetical protein RB597_000190 [Gaeumannomyces tritici]